MFVEIYRGKKRAKTVAELMKATKLNHVAVLQDGGKLAGLHIVNQIKIDGKTAYEKDGFIATNKNKILALASNPARDMARAGVTQQAIAKFLKTAKADIAPMVQGIKKTKGET